ncbi:uncharacterized protein LOC119361031 [Triticum dicoccoides]|uniref:uncharacterized protein LOC119361031 n=1 Tax=Triticum dicoccoides TaxID=85692 RepID=UPI00188DE51F|nr:uncharacterized protein LOC119361031 [Triticum dicoccoides]
MERKNADTSSEKYEEEEKVNAMSFEAAEAYPSLMVQRVQGDRMEDKGHRWNIFLSECKINNTNCKLIIDGGSYTNAVSKGLVDALGLPALKHPQPHHAEWLYHTGKLKVTHRVRVKFSIGGYTDKVPPASSKKDMVMPNFRTPPRCCCHVGQPPLFGVMASRSKLIPTSPPPLPRAVAVHHGKTAATRSLFPLPIPFVPIPIRIPPLSPLYWVVSSPPTPLHCLLELLVRDSERTDLSRLPLLSGAPANFAGESTTSLVEVLQSTSGGCLRGGDEIPSGIIVEVLTCRSSSSADFLSGDCGSFFSSASTMVRNVPDSDDDDFMPPGAEVAGGANRNAKKQKNPRNGGAHERMIELYADFDKPRKKLQRKWGCRAWWDSIRRGPCFQHTWCPQWQHGCPIQG